MCAFWKRNCAEIKTAEAITVKKSCGITQFKMCAIECALFVLRFFLSLFVVYGVCLSVCFGLLLYCSSSIFSHIFVKT